MENKVKLETLKKGDLFRRTPSGPYWVKGEYIRFSNAKKYSTHKYDDTNHEILLKGATYVFID